MHGPNMLRYKGVLHMQGTQRRVIFQGVHQVMGSDLGRAIDRSSTLPLHSQIKQILIEELQDTENNSAPVLTEASLMKRFHVSRAPVRQALKGLVDDGYVVRQRARSQGGELRFSVGQ